MKRTPNCVLRVAIQNTLQRRTSIALTTQRMQPKTWAIDRGRFNTTLTLLVHMQELVVMLWDFNVNIFSDILVGVRHF